MADTTGLEPATTCVTGRYTNHLCYVSIGGPRKSRTFVLPLSGACTNRYTTGPFGDSHGSRTRKFHLERVVTLPFVYGTSLVWRLGVEPSDTVSQTVIQNRRIHATIYALFAFV